MFLNLGIRDWVVGCNLEVSSQAGKDNMLSSGALSAEFCAFLQDLAKNSNIGVNRQGQNELCPITGALG